MYSNTENSIFSIETMFVVILFFYSSLQLSQTFRYNVLASIDASVNYIQKRFP